VIRWLFVIFLALVIFSALGPWLEKLGIGRLPGDLRFRIRGRDWYLPFASSVLLGLIALGIAHLL
jgi:hypothetical protein